MFKFDALECIHLEISNRCQASCPMCPRNIHGGIKNPSLKINDWSYEDFIHIISPEVLLQIKKLNFCGSFGDPIMNNDLIKMCEYIKTTSPNTRVEIHTNGSARPLSWWKQLAESLPQNHIVEFALDGLADTHSLYRVGTNWNTVIANAREFMAAGGNAIWMFIRFKHNEHQVEAAKHLSHEYGFIEFKLKDTRRFETSKFKVVDKQGNVTHYLEQPTDSRIRLVNRKDLETYKEWKQQDKIDCFALNANEVYIDACYTVMPCCILAAFIYTNYDKTILEEYDLYHEYSNVTIGSKIKNQVYGFIETLGGFDNVNVVKKSLRDIIDTDVWQTLWTDNWKTGGSIGCTVLCSADSPYIKIDEQWVDNV